MVGGWKEDGILRNNVMFGLELATGGFSFFFLLFYHVFSYLSGGGGFHQYLNVYILHFRFHRSLNSHWGMRLSACIILVMLSCICACLPVRALSF